MNKIFAAGVLLASISGTAFAADLPSRMAPPVYMPPPVPMFTWTGAYFGINAGYAFDNESRFRQSNGTIAAINSGVGTTRPVSVKNSSDGFTGGGQIGYNYQLPGFGGFGGPGGGIVFGVEADAVYMDTERTRTFSGINGAGVSVPNTFRSGLDFLGTVRGRLGVAFGQALIYGTGGLAYGSIDDRVNFLNTNGSTRFTGSRSAIETGYAYGGGIEYALPTSSFLNFFKSSAVTIKAEYLHYDLGSRTILLPAVSGGGGTGTYISRVSTDGNLARIGLNYKFGSY